VTITYQKSDAAFHSFPITSLQCVDDLAVDSTCKKCESTSLTYSLNSTDWAKVCKIPSDDGLSTTYCSSISNVPRITTSCYQGSFSAETPLLPSKCAPSLDDGLNNRWCIVSERCYFIVFTIGYLKKGKTLFTQQPNLSPKNQ
jgi:hypothetical protein